MSLCEESALRPCVHCQQHSQAQLSQVALNELPRVLEGAQPQVSSSQRTQPSPPSKELESRFTPGSWEAPSAPGETSHTPLSPQLTVWEFDSQGHLN